MKKKGLAVFLAVIIMIVLLSGCGEKIVIGSGGFFDKAEAGESLRFWSQLNGNVSKVASSMNEIDFTRALYQKTGIRVEYIHPVEGLEEEKFNLMLSSGEMPDIIMYDWWKFPGGPDQAIKDGYIAPLNDIIEEYAPNLYRLLSENPEINKVARTEAGYYCVFPTILPYEEMCAVKGPVIRNDWLKELNLPIPETLDDWYITLKAFRDKKGAQAPLSYAENIFSFGMFIGAFGIKQDFFLEGKTVRYGPFLPQYKEFIRLMNQWYREDLLDPNITSTDTRALDVKVLSGNTGATIGYINSGLGRWLTTKKENNGRFDLVSVPYPVMNRGETPQFGHRSSIFETTKCVAISASSNKKELAARFLDYAYSQEGHMLYNFGTEGLTYTIEDGKPRYTDLILNNPDGLSVDLALAKYTHASFSGAYVRNYDAFIQASPLEQQVQAMKIWSKTNAEKTNLPKMTLTTDENKELTGIMKEISAFVEEMTKKFIVGEEPLENLDKFEEQLKAMNVERAIQIQQRGFERFIQK